MEHEDQLRARLAEVKAEIIEIDERYENAYIDPTSDDGVKYNGLNAEHDNLTKTIAQVDARKQRIAEIAAGQSDEANGSHFHVQPQAARGKDIYDLSTVRASVSNPHEMRVELQDRARRAIDAMKFPHPGADQAGCQEHISRILSMVEDNDSTIAKRILTTSNPEYKEAFGRWVATGGRQFSAAMSVGGDSGADGGYAVPVELDPTLLPTSNGQVNPFRQVARVVQSTAKQWQAVTTTAVTATRRQSGDAAADNSPTLSQPVLTTSRVDVFIPFDIELQASWSGMQSELAMLIQDAKDLEEVTSFTTGNGTDPNPSGVLTGATITVSTGATATFASADLDLTEDTLPPRFRPNSVWMGNRTIYNKIRHFDSAGGPDLWITLSQALTQGGPGVVLPIHGRPAYENTAMGTATSSSSKLLVLGDFSRYFVIVDKIGLNLELVPHLFDTSTGYPTGQRGFYAYWHNTAKVLAAQAFVVLKAL